MMKILGKSGGSDALRKPVMVKTIREFESPPLRSFSPENQQFLQEMRDFSGRASCPFKPATSE
jgi:hypothetical protein